MAGHPEYREFKLRFDDAVNGADGHTAGATININAFIAFISFDDVDISLGDRLIGTFRYAESTGRTLIGDLHCH